MMNVKIGFVPSNWESWDGNAHTGKWAGKMRDRCVDAFRRVPGLELIVPDREMTEDGCVSTVSEGMRVAEYFRKENIQGLIIGNMTFGMEVAVGALLSSMPKTMPILHFSTPSGPIAENGARSTDTWCGQFMTASAIKRRGFDFVHLMPAEPEDEAFLKQIGIFTRAVCAVSRFRGARFGQIGTRPTLFESEYYSEENMQKQFSQTVVPMDLATAFSKMDAIKADEPDVKRIVEEIRAGAEIGDVYTEQSIVNQARYELSLERIAEELQVQAIAAACWTQLQERYGISACSTFSRLNEKGVITACEADLLGAASMWLMSCAALGQSKPDFIDWTDRHPTEKNVWLAWHCGNAASSLRAAGCTCKLMRNERMIQWCPNCHGAIEFPLKAGAVTCSRLVEYDGQYNLFAGTGEVVPIAPYTRGTYGWVKVNDLDDWERKMIDAGVVHHGTLIYDPLVADALELAARFLKINFFRGK